MGTIYGIEFATVNECGLGMVRRSLFGGISILGTKPFMDATRRALEILREEDYLGVVQDRIATIRQTSLLVDVRPTKGLYRVDRFAWRQDSRAYAAAIVYEAIRNRLFCDKLLLVDRSLELECINQQQTLFKKINADEKVVLPELARGALALSERGNAENRRTTPRQSCGLCLATIIQGFTVRLTWSRTWHAGIEVVGEALFRQATVDALKLLYLTRYSKTIAQNLKLIRQGYRTFAYVRHQGPAASVGKEVWTLDSTAYAGIIAHEAYHHVVSFNEGKPRRDTRSPCGRLKAEQSCLEFELEVLKELGAQDAWIDRVNSSVRYVSLLQFHPMHTTARRSAWTRQIKDFWTHR